MRLKLDSKTTPTPTSKENLPLSTQPTSDCSMFPECSRTIRQAGSWLDQRGGGSLQLCYPWPMGIPKGRAILNWTGYVLACETTVLSADGFQCNHLGASFS
jgi:hypothetical protein